MSLTLWLPNTAVEGSPDNEGRFSCNLCGARFHDPTVWEKHLGPCKNRHLDEIRARAPSVKHKGTPFDPETWDPEEERHMLKVGDRMLREGSWEVKPNERPGAAGGGVL